MVTEGRQRMLLELRRLIKNGKFDFNAGDGWYEEDYQYFLVHDNNNLELVEIEYHWEWSSRGMYDVWGRGESGEGRETLGNVLDFVLNRKFGNTTVEDKWQEVIKYLRNTDDYGIQDAITTEVDSWGDDHDDSGYDDFDYENEYEDCMDEEEQEYDYVEAEDEAAAIIKGIEETLE